MKRHHIVFLLVVSMLFASACVLERGFGGFFEEGSRDSAQLTAAVEATVWKLLETDEASAATDIPVETPAATAEPTRQPESLPDSSVEAIVNCDMSYLTPDEKQVCGEHAFQVSGRVSDACPDHWYSVDGEQVKEMSRTLTFTISFTESSASFGTIVTEKVSSNHYSTTDVNGLPREYEIIGASFVQTGYSDLVTGVDEPVACYIDTYTLMD